MQVMTTLPSGGPRRRLMVLCLALKPRFSYYSTGAQLVQDNFKMCRIKVCLVTSVRTDAREPSLFYHFEDSDVIFLNL